MIFLLILPPTFLTSFLSCFGSSSSQKLQRKQRRGELIRHALLMKWLQATRDQQQQLLVLRLQLQLLCATLVWWRTFPKFEHHQSIVVGIMLYSANICLSVSLGGMKLIYLHWNSQFSRVKSAKSNKCWEKLKNQNNGLLKIFCGLLRAFVTWSQKPRGQSWTLVIYCFP